MTTATNERTLAVGDIIEIAQFDECCNLALRRVRVAELSRSWSRLQVVGVNLHGNFPAVYKLPLHPFKELVSAPCTTIWAFTESIPGEE